MSAITNTTGRWLVALVATALVLALMVGGDQPSARAIGPGETDIAYVADGYNFPDALMGATLAALNNAPMLGVRGPTTGDVVPPETADELDRLTNDKANPLATIYVFGGPAAVSAKVVEELGAWADDVERIFGDNRFATMEAISGMLPTKAKDSDLLDGKDSSAFALSADPQVHFYTQVIDDGRTFNPSHPGEFDATRTGTGQYQVAFPANVRTCAHHATLTSGPGSLYTIAGYRFGESDDVVGVRTYNSSGTASDLGFVISVIC